VAGYYFDDIVTYKERWQMQTAWDTKILSTILWITDQYNNRVQKFVNGVYAGQIGCSTGACSQSSANGSFNTPTYVSIDSANNIWVSDTGNHRVEKFNSCGVYQMSLGAGYNGVSGSPGSLGYNNGQFNQPGGIAFDGSGNVWVGDHGPNNTIGGRIQEFSSTGTWMMSLGGGGICISGSCTLNSSTNATSSSPSSANNTITCNTTSGCPSPSGTATANIFGGPSDLVFDSSGNLWVLDVFDYYNPPIKEINPNTGGFINTLGTQGYSNGGFRYPSSSAVGVGGYMAFDSSGNLWVSDWSNARIQELNSTGAWMMSIGGGNGVNSGLCISGSCTLNSSGNATITGSPSAGPVSCSTSSACTTGSKINQFTWPIGMRLDSKGNVYVADSANGTVQEFTNGGVYIKTIASYGTNNGQVVYPFGLAISR
jgi:hypothetical protein